MRKKIAIVDLGTNTFNLLIVELAGSEFSIVESIKRGVGLGLGGIHKNLITEDAFLRGILALKAFKKRIDYYGIEAIYPVGTSALRNASNTDEFKRQVALETGMNISVISGQEEAHLIYNGAIRGYNIKEPTLIMDIGGGSTEFILCDGKGMINGNSFEIGVARILHRINFSDPYTAKNCKEVYDYLDEKVGVYFNTIKANILLGTSGSFETFFSLLKSKEYPENEYEKMTTDQMLNVLDAVIQSTFEERKNNPFIIPIREKMLPIAALKVKYVIEKLKNKNIVISPFALKEGMLQKIIANAK